MDVLIIGDFHIPGKADRIPGKFMEEIKEVDVVMCTGDYTNEETFDKVARNAEKLHTVKGNQDFMRLPIQDIVTVGGLKFGLIHGHQVDRGDLEGLTEIVDSLDVKMLVSGHTHQPYKMERENILLLNPGSATGARSGESRAKAKTCMKLKIEDEKLQKINVLKA